jgi:hypothetical protein
MKVATRPHDVVACHYGLSPTLWTWLNPLPQNLIPRDLIWKKLGFKDHLKIKVKTR